MRLDVQNRAFPLPLFCYLGRMFEPADLFDLNQTEHAAIFDGCKFAWEALEKIEGYIAANLKPALRNKCEGTAFVGDKVFIGEGTVLEDGVMIKGPAIIGKNCQNPPQRLPP